MGAEQERDQERADGAIAVFEIEAKLAKIAYGTRTLAAIPAEAGQTISALTRLYDMTVVLQPESARSSYDNEIPQADPVQLRRADADVALITEERGM